jgi:SAM-dependent methyltransferase
MSEARERRLVFGEVADQYERARPDYPAAAFLKALEYAGHREDEWVVDIGAGTGKATAGWAAAGARVVALEPNAEMARVARRRFAGDARVTVVEASFEEWEADGAFAIVSAAQAWHWVDPAVRLERARSVLRSGGTLALLWNQPQYPDRALRRALDDAYAELAPDARGRFAQGTPRPLDGQDMAIDELRASPRFDGFVVHELANPIVYDAAQYVDLIGTHSDHRLLAGDARAQLLDRIGALVEGAGSITVHYRTTLVLARRGA